MTDEEKAKEISENIFSHPSIQRGSFNKKEITRIVLFAIKEGRRRQEKDMEYTHKPKEFSDYVRNKIIG